MTKKYTNKITTYLDDKDNKFFESHCEILGLEASSFARLAIKEKLRSERIILNQSKSISTEAPVEPESAANNDLHVNQDTIKK